MLRRVAQSLTVALLAAVMLGADAGEARFSRVGHQMMCVCSCGQVLLECNHVGCPDSDRMIGELRDQMVSGRDDRTILGWFAQKYGATVLAAPIRGGFDTVAWVTPVVLFLLATIGTAFVVRSWTSRRSPLAQATGPWPSSMERSEHRARIRRETEV